MAMRIVQVGMGGSGRVWARDHVPPVDDVDLVGCVDRDKTALNVAQDEVGIAERCSPRWTPRSTLSIQTRC